MDAYAKYYDDFEMCFENGGEAALKCKECNSILRNINHLSDAVGHINRGHKEAKSKVSKLIIQMELVLCGYKTWRNLEFENSGKNQEKHGREI